MRITPAGRYRGVLFAMQQGGIFYQAYQADCGLQCLAKPIKRKPVF